MNKESIRSGKGEEREKGRCPPGDILLLCWVLGIFYYFYQSRGYLDLLRRLLGG